MSKEPNRNVYVGHRYVPKIMGEWDNKIKYEGLSIVLHEGTSYTSKGYVPVGIDIKNEEFWAITGNYNVQVEHYRNDVENVKSQLNDKSDITYVDTELGKKADKTYVNTELDKKADTTYVDTELGKKSDKTYVDTELGKKSDQTYVDTNLEQIYINVKSFGAMGDGETDDTDSIINAVDYLKNADNNSTLYFPESTGNYVTNKTIHFPENINVNMKGRISYNGLSNIPVIVVGSTNNIIHKKKLVLNATRLNESDWSSENSITVKVFNATTCHIEITEASNSTIGYQEIGSGRGFSYNNVMLYAIQENKYGIDLTNENNGWCNENIHIGGRFAVSGYNQAKGNRHAIRVTSKNDYINNNNIFLKPSFEIGSSTNGESIPVLVEYGSGTHVEYGRNETPYPVTAKYLNDSNLNNVNINYGQYNQIDESKSKSNYGSNNALRQLDSINKVVYNSGALINKINIDGVTVTSDDFFFNNRSDGTDISDSGLAIRKTETGIFIPEIRGMGIRYYPKGNDKFVIDRSGEGRYVIRLFDENGEVLNSGLSFLTYNRFNFNEAYGGVFITGSNHDNPVFFSISDEVKYFDIIFYGDIDQFTLYSNEFQGVAINPLNI